MIPNVVLIRHAHTYGNCEQRIGYTDRLDRLTPQGVLQAIRLGPKLQGLIENFGGQVNIVCSETRRTYQTAVHAGVIHPSTKFTTHPNLNEFESKDNLLSSLMALRRKDTSLPDGLSQVQDRVLEYIHSLDESELNILFSHGATTGTVYHAVHPSLAIIPENASINQFTLKNGKLTIT